MSTENILYGEFGKFVDDRDLVVSVFNLKSLFKHESEKHYLDKKYTQVEKFKHLLWGIRHYLKEVNSENSPIIFRESILFDISKNTKQLANKLVELNFIHTLNDTNKGDIYVINNTKKHCLLCEKDDREKEYNDKDKQYGSYKYQYHDTLIYEYDLTNHLEVYHYYTKTDYTNLNNPVKMSTVTQKDLDECFSDQPLKVNITDHDLIVKNTKVKKDRVDITLKCTKCKYETTVYNHNITLCDNKTKYSDE